MTPKQKEVMILINKKVREDKEVNPNPELENIRLSRNHINELLSYMTKLALIISENRTIEVRQHSVSKLIWEDVVTGEWYYFNHLKFL
jgi:hypothetical protein